METDFRALSFNRELAWSDVAEIPWAETPVSGSDDIECYARDVAGRARDFSEFYKPENRRVARAVEEWLTRYSAAHTHPSLRS